MAPRRGLDTDVRRVMLGRVERFQNMTPEALEQLAEELHAPSTALVADLGTAFAAHERSVEQLVDVAPPELVKAVAAYLRELQQWSEAARLTAANTTVGTFHYQTGTVEPDETVTVTRDGVVWGDRTGERGRYALAMFVATNASDIRGKTRAIPPHVIDRAVVAANTYLGGSTTPAV